jgi:hypothetical protein
MFREFLSPYTFILSVCRFVDRLILGWLRDVSYALYTFPPISRSKFVNFVYKDVNSI